jgi:hypothetical protein
MHGVVQPSAAAVPGVHAAGVSVPTVLPRKGGGVVPEAPEVVPEVAPEPTPEVAPEPTPEAVPEPTPEAVPEPTPEAVPEPTPEVVPEPTPEVVPEPTPEVVPEVVPEPTEPDVVPVIAAEPDADDPEVPDVAWGGDGLLEQAPPKLAAARTTNPDVASPARRAVFDNCKLSDIVNLLELSVSGGHFRSRQRVWAAQKTSSPVNLDSSL